jgi:methylated-DNA-protein-cysteine methyltransferase related protein
MKERSMLSDLRRTVRKIPRGRVSTYGAIAKAAGYPGRARQVAWALRNCEPALPWHRVVGAGGRILLSGEAGLEQRLRLRQEGVRFEGDRVVLSAHEFVFKPVPARAPNDHPLREW